ncbi:ROK family protein [Luteococcus sp. OSA5]|uniref:ROK family protein n=1 Tax=Luteococcus sp. OSA5 TaxID=3401630 RepID=UPI003B42BF27
MTESSGMPVLAVDLGGTNVRAALVHRGAVKVQSRLRTPAREGAEAVIEAVLEALSRIEHGPVAGIGIASAGVVDRGSGRILAATDLIKGWAGTHLAEAVSGELALPVRVINDVHAHALGEWHHGAGRGARSLLLVAAGTGLGGAMILDGRLVEGANHVAGHLGHVPCPQAEGLQCSCGATGHLESVASGSGLEALHRHLCPGAAPASARELTQRASSDPEARHSVTTSGRALGEAIGGWCNLLDPERIVVTGGLSHAGDVWWQSLREGHRASALASVRHTPVVAAKHADDAALLGAATLFTDPIPNHGAHHE